MPLADPDDAVGTDLSLADGGKQADDFSAFFLSAPFAALPAIVVPMEAPTPAKPSMRPSPRYPKITLIIIVSFNC